MTEKKPLALLWFRQDLRLADNPALTAAAKTGPVIALFVWDDTLPWADGAAARWWLHYALDDLAASLKKHGITLLLKKGSAEKLVPQLAKQLGATHLFCNRLYEPAAAARDEAITKALEKAGVATEIAQGNLLFEPWEIKNKSGKQFKVYSAFARTCRQVHIPKPLATPRGLQGAKPKVSGDKLANWKFLPTAPDWSGEMTKAWRIGEGAGQRRLKAFVEDHLHDYPCARDTMGADETSRLSPYLHFGHLSARQVYHAIHGHGAAADKFISELFWREFSHHLLHHFPKLPDQALHERFRKFPWQRNVKHLKAWQRGQTGIPIVDAGMRQLWQTGWMHNRVRMIVASFLVKNLLQPWQDGEAWFWDTLVDADLADNSQNWQWIAGCGADAAPFFRVFNPVRQAWRFDRDGTYVRRWVPELAKLPDKALYAPWEAKAELLEKAGVELGKTYPKPLVDLNESRARALAAFKKLRNA